MPEKKKAAPLLDQEFIKRSLHPVDIEERRRFEELLIRYDLGATVDVSALIASAMASHITSYHTDIVEDEEEPPIVSGDCLWTLEGSNIVRYGGAVGVGISPLQDMFEVRGTVLIEDTDALVQLELRNWSDSEYDTVVKWSKGSAPVTLYTVGVDDSDSDKWKIANLSALGTLAESQGSYGEKLIFFHDYDHNLCEVDLDDFSTDSIIYNGTSGSGDGQFGTVNSITFDGTYIYVADNTNSRIQKFDYATGAYVSKVTVRRPWGLCHWSGYLYTITQTALSLKYHLYKINADTMAIENTYEFDYGSGDAHFNGPRGMCTDGANLYICDTGNNRVKKCTMAGVYVAKVGSSGSGDGQFGTTSPIDCELDGTYLYVCDHGNSRVQIFDVAGMTYQAKHNTQLVSGFLGKPSSIAINDTYYYVNCNNDDPGTDGYIEKYDIATRTFQASYDTILIAAREDVGWSAEIAKFATSGTRYGDLFVVHNDGSYIDTWPIVRFMDDVRLVEDGDLATGDYVGLRAPSVVTTSYTLTFPAALPAGTSHVYSSAGGTLAFGQDVNTTASPTFVSLILNQGSADDAILQFKSSDVAHGMTAFQETDTYAAFSKVAATEGGVKLRGLTEGSTGVTLSSFATSDNTTKSTSGRAGVEIYGHKKSGTGVTDPGANANIFGIFKSAAPSALWLCDVEGDVWQAGSVTALTVKLSNLTNGYIPYHVSDTDGLANSVIYTDGTYVGINTTSPSDWFEVVGQDYSNVSACAKVNVAKYGWSEMSLKLRNDSATPAVAIIWSFGAEGDYADDGTISDAGFYIYNPMSWYYNLCVNQNGDFGLGGVTMEYVADIGTKSVLYIKNDRNVGICQYSFGTDAVNVFAIATGTAPSTAPADAFQMYSKDVSAGNAAPHFLLEGGEEVSLRNDGYYVDGVRQKATMALDDLSDVDAAAPNDGEVLTWVAANSAWEAAAGGGGAGAFLDLSDVTEADYTGHGGQFVKVNVAETGLEFSASSVANHDLTSASHPDVDNTGLSDDDILRYDSASGTWKCEALPAAANHNLLDGSVHGDTVAQTVSRGSIIYGNSTPKWDELVIGAAGSVLKSDGTDCAWAAQNTFKLDDFGAPDDNTDLDVGTAKHGLCPKAPNDSQKFLRGDATWAILDYLFGYRIQGRYYTGGLGINAITTGVYGADYIRAIPFIVTKTQTFDRIGIGVTASGGAGRYMRLGIYASDFSSGYAYPGALVLDSGAIEVTSNTFWEVNISQSLTPGLYWLVLLPGYSFTFRAANSAYSPCSAHHFGSVDGATVGAHYFTVAQSYGALPDPYPAGASVGTGTAPPFIVVRTA